MWVRYFAAAVAVSQATALLEPFGMEVAGPGTQAVAQEPPSDQGQRTSTVTIEPPPGVNVSDVESLKVSMAAESVTDRQGFYIRFFALLPGENDHDPQQVSLDTVAIFKPPREGDVFAGVVHEPPAHAWIDGKHLTLGFEILPAVEGQAIPRLELRIDTVELITTQKR